MEIRLEVSKEFVEIYRNFNVVNQIEEIGKLSDKERYLLLLCCLDSHDEDIATVKFNFQPFKDEVMELIELQDDVETTNEVILNLMSETGDKYIDTSVIVTSDGHKLPEPYTKSEIRNKKLSLLGDNSN